MTIAPTAVDVAAPDRRRWILVATIIGSSMTFIDGTVVNIALPTIGRDLHAGLSAQQWVMLSYSLAVASLYIVFVNLYLTLPLLLPDDRNEVLLLILHLFPYCLTYLYSYQRI